MEKSETILYGHVPDQVIDWILEGVADTMRSMTFMGPSPVVHISEGPIQDDQEKQIHACYTHADSAVRIWWQGVAAHIYGVPDEIRERVVCYFFAAHEAVHHVQWCRGYGELTPARGTNGYSEHAVEQEANTIAHAVTAVRFGLQNGYNPE